jgi:hypothetical protein
MTFLGKDSRQYVVVAAGGGSFLGAAPARRSSRTRFPLKVKAGFAVVLAIAACAAVLPAQTPARKHVLAWADVRNGYQHDSISHAVATIERLGRESGDYDTFIAPTRS